MGIYLPCTKIRQIAAIIDFCFFKLCHSLWRIADTVDRFSHLLQPAERSDEEFLQFAGSLSVAPVSYPIHVGPIAGNLWIEMDGVGGFVKCPGSPGLKHRFIDLANCFPKSQHAIEPVNLEL